MSSLGAYEALARYYDLQHRTFTDDHVLYLALAAEHGPDAGVLELGAGTGRIMLPLVQAGHRVVGVDESPAMLDLARAHLARHKPQLYDVMQADSRALALPDRFDMCVIALNTFLHNLTREDQQATLRTAHTHLKPGGRLVIDLPPNDEMAHQPDDGEYVFEARMVDPAAKTEVDKFVASRLYWASQQQQLSYRVIETALSQARTTEVSFRLRHCFKHEMELLLINAGFAAGNWQWFGDYLRAPYDEGSARMIVCATKSHED
jgi:SAM-dependent methyltransferase